MTNSRSLVDRLLLSFPVGDYGLTALLRVCQFEESRQIPTACIECARRPRLLVNPDFVDRYARTSAALLTLLLHELHHLILGHSRLYPRTTLLDNFIFDCVINALLTHLRPEPDAVALFTGFYPADMFPACFLRPPEGWLPGQGRMPLPKALRAMGRRDLDELYRALYGSATGVTYSELREGLRSAVDDEMLELIVLLGDHGDETDSSSDGRLVARSPALRDTLAEAIRRWGIEGGAGGPYDELARASVGDVQAGDRRALRRLLRRVAGPGGAGRAAEPAPRTIEIQSAVPVADRRSMALRTIGQEPLLFNHVLETPRPASHRSPVHVYCDVSGSMSERLGSMYGAILACRALVHPEIHLFSTMVADVSLAALRDGACPTTRGTRIACVAQHIREHGVRRACVLTDGNVGPLLAPDAHTLRSIVLGVALTSDGRPDLLVPLARHLELLSA